MKPEITVLLPVRDALPHLPAALASLSAQSLGEWVCLVWDDGARDGSREVLEAHALADRRFRVLGDGTPRGVAGALDQLLARVETPWAARMDADDVCRPRRLAVQREAARRNSEVALWGGGVASPPDSPPSPGWAAYLEWLNGVVEPGAIVRNAFTECPVPHPTWFGRTAALREAGGYREGPFPEDYDLFLRLLRRGNAFGKVPEVVLHWRDHPARETRRSPRTRRDAFLRLKARHFAEAYPKGELPHLPRRAVAVWGAGKTGRILLTELRRHGLDVDAVVDPLRDPGARVAGFPVHPPTQSPPGRHLLLVAVGPRPLREQLEVRFREEGREFGRDYLWMY